MPWEAVSILAQPLMLCLVMALGAYIDVNRFCNLCVCLKFRTFSPIFSPILTESENENKIIFNSNSSCSAICLML